ncbi:MAG: LD-carboxypeptidase [Myxococcota bacterium]
MSRTLELPVGLRDGGTIRLVAPSSPFDPAALEKGRQTLMSMGFRISEPPDLSRADRYLAASDETRALELVDALCDREAGMVLAARGGYGATRLLPILDRYESKLRAAQPKLLCGFSDITALHSYLYTTLGWRSVHGPVCTSLAHEPDETRTHFCRVVQGNAGLARLTGTALRGRGTVVGRLVGGNLAVLVAMAGTRWWPDLSDSILFLEDDGERPYRLDRLLTQLLQTTNNLSGVLGVALGAFSNCEDKEKGFTAEQVLRSIFADAAVPVVMDLPFGHIPGNHALPHGALARLDADAGTLTFLEEAVTRA